MREMLMVLVLAGATAGCCAPRADAQAPAPAESAPAEPAEPVEVAEPAPAEPAPDPGARMAAGRTGVAECDDYFAAIEKMVQQCPDKMPPQTLDAIQQARDAFAASLSTWDTMTPEERKAQGETAAAGCKAASDAIRQAAAAMDCPLE